MANELTTVNQQEFSPTALPDESTLKHEIDVINRFQAVVRQCLVPDLDYGIIPGTGTKPSLFKPGAEKIAKLLGLSDQYNIIDRQEDWSKPFFRYMIKCQLISVRNGVVVSEGLGECNSFESKYRYRDAKRKCPACGAEAIIKGKEEYGGGWLCYKRQGGCGQTFADNDSSIIDQVIGKVENEDIFTQVNTLIKMAKKRALVDASLSAGRLSNIFTQDIEDFEHAPKQTVVQNPKPDQAKTLKRDVKPVQQKENQQTKQGIKNLGDLYAACLKNYSERFATKDDVLKFLNTTEQEISDPAGAFEAIKMQMDHD